jgi:hypothetical protein
LHCDIANRKFSASCKQSPVSTSLRKIAGSKRLRCESIAVNRQIESVAENFKAADMIGVFVCENNAIELLGCDATLLETQHDLSRAQTAINQNLAMFGGD